MWKKRPLEPSHPKQERLGFEFALPQTDLTVKQEVGFTRLRLKGGHLRAEPGAPQIPYLTAHIAIPDGARVLGIKVMQTARTRLEGKHAVEPAQLPGIANLRFQPPQLKDRFRDILQIKAPNLEVRRPEFTMPDPVKYQLQTLYPAALAEVTTERRLGPYRMLAVQVNPVQYIPAEGALYVNHTFTVAVDLARPVKRRLPVRSPWSQEQLQRWYDLASTIVLNPEDLRLPTGYKAPGGKAPYLVVTNKAMQPEFDRLAEWKTQTGLAARVVTMEDIQNKIYGDFSTGAGGPARDAQEVLRNFLKWAMRTWKVCYLLLGGDVETIPVRKVAALSHYNWYTKTAAVQPEENRCYYDSVKKRTVVRMGEALNSSTPLLAITSGRRIPYNTSASESSPGWYYATNNMYNTQSAAPTKFVVIKGQAALINDPAGFYRIQEEHSIPTDLYYASLDSPLYNRPGKHDWDAQNIGLYGYYNETANPSGIDFTPDLCVGRAPCSNPSQAKAFVDKVIRYEKHDGISAFADRKALFAADYWGGPVVIDPAGTGVAVPGENQYLATNATTCRITLKETPAYRVDLIAEDSASIFRSLPYRSDASATKPGWYYADGPTSMGLSGIRILGFDLPIPTRWIVVRGPSGTVSPARYWVDNAEPDGGLIEKEQVRSLFRAQAPQVDLHQRLYRDFASVPAASAGDTVTTSMLTTSGLVSALNEGAMHCSFTGHGWHGGCCLIGRNEARSLTNGMNLPVMFADSCSTGSFDQSDAFGEEMLVNPAGGAIAYLGNTRWSWIGLGDDIERIFWDKLFVASHTLPLGIAFDSRMQILSAPGWAMLWKWSCLALNLLGDPAMRPWAGVPQPLRMRAPAKATPFSTIRVTVVNAAGRPVPGAKVCVYQRGRLLRYGWTSAAGTIDLTVAGAARGRISVTATRPGCVPDQRSVALV